MSGDTLVELMRGGWIVLTLLMLLSRVIFQAVGAVRMRSFLNEWQDGTTKRIWGATSLLFAAVLAVGALSAGDELGGWDWILLVLLLAVLVADGLVNVLPAGFRTFKDRMQAAWVARHHGTGREGDRHLFGTVNALLAAGSIAALAVVLWYRPIEPLTVVLAVAIAVVVLAVLLVPPLRRTR
jgi:multisubunit Na+/H+ antiporter MnhG subunit